MINLHERKLLPLAGIAPATSWSPFGGVFVSVCRVERVSILYYILTLKVQSQIVADAEKISLGISSESSARQMIHMKCQDLFFSEKYLKNQNVVCYSCGLH